VLSFDALRQARRSGTARRAARPAAAPQPS